mmetsp:Transcript_6591/g.11460  ORF Transcript_6591/g.11460 Transcript_6591/m.11460 type:complete len:307 (-) Transcript_6591:23-943(-)
MVANVARAERMLACLAALALCAESTVISNRVTAQSNQTPNLPVAAHDAWQASEDTSMSSVAARTAAKEVYARLDAEEAEGAASKTDDITSQTMEIATEARRDLRGSIAAAQGATSAAKASKEALAWAEKYANSIEAEAGKQAAAMVRQRLAGLLRELQEWKAQLLHNPVDAALTAGAKAALPYQEMAQALDRKAVVAGREVARLNAQAQMRSEAAKDVAEDAAAKGAEGDHAGAEKAQALSEQLAEEAAALKRQGVELQSQVDRIEAQIPSYLDGAELAGSQAAHMNSAGTYGPPLVAHQLPVLPH